MIHELKCWKKYFDRVWSGEKLFELRKNDRGFKENDRLRLREYDLESGYSGREIHARITYVLGDEEVADFGLMAGYAILSFEINSFTNNS